MQATASDQYTIASAIRSGTDSFTFLVPPENVLEDLRDASMSAATAASQKGWTIDSLLLNVLEGYYTLESLDAAAQKQQFVFPFTYNAFLETS